MTAHFNLCTLKKQMNRIFRFTVSDAGLRKQKRLSQTNRSPVQKHEITDIQSRSYMLHKQHKQKERNGMKIKDTWHLPDAKQAARRIEKTSPTIHGISISEAQKTLGNGKTYYISTYGCQANERDSENLAGILEACGYVPADTAENADIILMNTCGIRENAANNVLGEVGNHKKQWKQKPDTLIGVCGCMVQEEGFTRTLLEKYPWVHLIFGTHNFPNLPEYLERAQNGEKVVEIYSREGEIYEDLPEHRQGRYKGLVNIMYGCDKFCTYCIVPYTRGRQRSRKLEDILEEVRTLKKLGYKEITLLGQNVNAYGKDLEDGVEFSTVLEETAKTGIERVRFMTSHPWDFSEKMIDIIAKYPNIMPFVHLPLQSGDDEILRRMGRRYTSEEYLRLFHMIKDRVPGVAISTDIIVGFPGEDEEAFEHTLDVVRECAFDNAYTFIYSPRPGTPAARMEDDCDLAVKKERLYKLNKLWNDLALEAHQKYKGEIVTVLVDGPSKKNPNILSGYSEHAIPVNFSAPDPSAIEEGDLVRVRITDVHTFSLNGELAEE